MNVRSIDSEIKLKQWTEIIRECRNSSQSVRSWCIEHDVDEKRYYYWLRKIREQACKSMEPAVSFQQVVPIIKLHIDKITVEISDGMSQETISYVLNGIKDIC